MKAMVLAAGLGLRMRPLSLLRAKPALPVLNRPLLRWTLERLARHGVTDVVINLHHRPASVRRAVGEPGRLGLRVRYSHERTILGTAGGPRRVRRFFGDEPFLLVNGDVVFDFDLTRLVARHRAGRARATLALKPNPDPTRYGRVVTAPDGRVRSLAGLPRRARGRVSLFTGVQVLDPALLERLPRGFASSVPDLYAPLIAEGERVLGVRMAGPWHDLGSPSLYLASQLALLARLPGRTRSLLGAGTRIGTGARVRRSVIGPDAVIERGAEVSGSVLWDSVRIGAGARVRRCVVADRVVIPAGARLSRAVVLRGRAGAGWRSVELTSA
jgi:NDP-sugar pyrophosphorylase family protein